MDVQSVLSVVVVIAAAVVVVFRDPSAICERARVKSAAGVAYCEFDIFVIDVLRARHQLTDGDVSLIVSNVFILVFFASILVRYADV